MKINEMATDRSSAREWCNGIGRQFIIHFVKAFEEYQDEQLRQDNQSWDAFSHHCGEMQSWWSDVNGMVLTNGNRSLNDIEIREWFLMPDSEAYGIICDTVTTTDAEVVCGVYRQFCETLRNASPSIDMKKHISECFKRLIDGRYMTCDDGTLPKLVINTICMDSGRQFIRDFGEAYNLTPTDPLFVRLCDDMQKRWNEVSNLIVHETGRPISNSDLFGWFFSAGGDISRAISDIDEADIYDTLCAYLTYNRGSTSIYELMTNILNGK